MKHFLLFAIPVFALGCNSAAPVSNSNRSATNVTNQSNEVKSVIAHSSEGQQTGLAANSNGSSGKWSRSGDPIETAAFDSKIAAAEKAHKAKPDDESAKKALAEAYFERGFALTEARQYAAALGDYRRALKLEPDHEESQKWIDQILKIYASIGKSAPGEGEEPEPLPFKKQS
jgi:tetratricopeptide (TPR) repeat protein